MVSFKSRISSLIFCLPDLFIDDKEVLKSLTTTILGSICAFKSFSVYLMKLCALTLSAFGW
jgi:hypothetical protein